MEAEKENILKQRIRPLDLEGFDQNKLNEKAKKIHSWLSRLEGEKYDLEKRLHTQQTTLQDLAGRARNANKTGKGGLKRVGEETIDKMQEKFTGAPAKVEMFSKYERQKDNRSYNDKFNCFTGPQFISASEKIKPGKNIMWNEEGMPVYGSGKNFSSEE